MAPRRQTPTSAIKSFSFKESSMKPTYVALMSTAFIYKEWVFSLNESIAN